jgi:hypothetical protein
MPALVSLADWLRRRQVDCGGHLADRSGGAGSEVLPLAVTMPRIFVPGPSHGLTDFRQVLELCGEVFPAKEVPARARPPLEDMFGQQ